jgi:OOP family OmpA-OmpF porin
MNIKKLIHFVACLLMVTSIHAQSTSTDWGWDWADSSKVPASRMAQQTEFLNNQYPYPAKPRTMTELAIYGGKSQIFGDVQNYKFGYGVGLSIRKSISHVFSWRVAINYQKSEGIDPKLWTSDVVDGFFGPNWPYRGFTTYNGYVAFRPGNPNPVFRAFAPNYRNKSLSGNFDLVVSLAALSHYRGNPKWDVYVFGGYALINSDVDTRLALGGNPAAPFNFFTVNYNQSSEAVQSAVHDLVSQSAPAGGAEGNWTNAPHRMRRDDLGDGNWMLNHALTFGGGFSYKFSDRFNLGFEDRVTNPFSGDMDAINTGSSDLFNLATIQLKFNLGNKARRVQPLYWLNPNNYVYSELNVPRHMKLPRVVLPDGDGDGITDQFDLEPNTPKGCPVDSHGVSKDTDGDGVPDCRDKEILTQLKCFPVNADGVGTCPEPACCQEIRDLLKNQPVAPVAQCTIGGLPSVQFKNGSAKLSKAAESVLANAAATIKANPNCNIRVIGYGASSKAAQQMSWERVNAVIKYLTERQGISESRLLFQYGQDGDANTVDLQGTTETGPTMVPAPHPNLKSRG